MCTFARLKHLLMIRRRGSQCCVTLVGMLLAVSILKIAYHSKFSEGMAKNSLILNDDLKSSIISLAWSQGLHYTVLPYTQCQLAL